MDESAHFLNTIEHAFEYNPLELLTNMGLALILGVMLGYVYRITHKAGKYSQSFALTIVFSCVIFSVVMLLIGSSLSRAFALVGALSVIRFQTVVKDSKDTAFVFAAFVIGMALGIGEYAIGTITTCAFSLMAIGLHKINFGAQPQSCFYVELKFDAKASHSDHIALLNHYAYNSKLAKLKSVEEGQFVQLKYNMNTSKRVNLDKLKHQLEALKGVASVKVVNTRQGRLKRVA